MKFLTLMFLFLSSTGFSDNTCPIKKKPEVKCVEETPKPKVIVKTVEKQVNTPCCEKDKTTETDAEANASVKTGVRAETGDQTVKVNIIMPKAEKPKTKTRIKKVEVEVEVTNPNRLLLLLGASRTGVTLEENGCCDFDAVQEYEPDVGLQYLRDVGSFTGSIGGTIQRNVYVGVGFNW